MTLAESDHLSIDSHGRLWLETARWIATAQSTSCSGSSPCGASSTSSAEPSVDLGPAVARPCCLGPAASATWPARLGPEPAWFTAERTELATKWSDPR